MQNKEKCEFEQWRDSMRILDIIERYPIDIEDVLILARLREQGYVTLAQVFDDLSDRWEQENLEQQMRLLEDTL